MLGYSIEELQSLDFQTVTHPDDVAESVGVMARLQTGTEGSARLEKRYLHKNGSVVWVDLSTVLLRDAAGQPHHFVADVQDTTARKQAEAKLRESEEKYRLVVDNASDAILVAQDGSIVFANPRTGEVVGYPREELLGRPFTDFIHPDDRGLIAENHRRRAAGEDIPAWYEFRIVSRSGETRQVEINAVRIDWRGRPATLDFLADVTDRRRAEETLTRHHAMLQAVLESSEAAIFSLDREYRYTSYNSGHASVMKQIYGRDIELGHSLAEYQTNQEDWGRAKASLDRALAGEQLTDSASSGEEGRARRYFEVLHTPIRDSQGGVSGVAVYALDITERKRTEEEIEWLITRRPRSR